MSTKDGGDVGKPTPPEHQSLKAPDIDGARNASGEVIKTTEATRTNASDGSLRDRAKLIAEQDDSIQIMGMGGRAASRTNRLSESELIGSDPKTKSIDIRELLAKPEPEAQALVNEFGRVTNMPAGADRDAAFSQVQQLADKTYGRGEFANQTAATDAQPAGDKIQIGGRFYDRNQILASNDVQSDVVSDATNANVYETNKDKIVSKGYEKTSPTLIKSGLDFNTADVPLSQKLATFANSAQARLLDPEGRKAYFQGVIDETLGIGEGLNVAKEELKESTKTAANKAWTALTDGSVANFMATPNAINEPLFKTIGSCLDTMSRDPNAVNNVLTVMGRELQTASDKYSRMAPHERGVQDGKAMFYFINPSGSTEGGELAIQAADKAIAPVDKALNETIQTTVKAAQELAQTSAESALQTKQMLLDYLQTKGIAGPQLKLAGVPDGFFEGMQPTQPFKASDYFNAMSETENAGSYRPSEGYRGDHDPYSNLNEKGRIKSKFNEAGDLVPPNPEGLYKGRPVTIAEHLNGGWSKGAKKNSPFTSFGHDGVVQKFGKKFEIKVDLDKIRNDIANGNLQGVSVIEHEEVLEGVHSSNVPPGVKTYLINCATTDKEVLVKGIIPSRFILVKVK